MLLEIFAFIYLIALPLALKVEFGIWVIPSCFLMGMCYNVLLDIANQLEDPFGYDESDLNLDVFCHVAETQVCRVQFFCTSL